MTKLQNVPDTTDDDAEFIKDGGTPTTAPYFIAEIEPTAGEVAAMKQLADDYLAKNGVTGDLGAAFNEVVAKHGKTEAGFHAFLEIVMEDARLSGEAAAQYIESHQSVLPARFR